MIAMSVIFLLQQITSFFWPGMLENFFGLHYIGFFQEYKIWQIMTYMFLHGGWLHLIGNMIYLGVFGDNIEDTLGHFRYVLFYCFGGGWVWATLVTCALLHQSTQSASKFAHSELKFCIMYVILPCHF